MKKFEFHLDALIIIIVVFVLLLSFLLFQRYQYSEILQDNIDLAWENENLNVDIVLTTNLLDKCKNEKNSKEESKVDKELANITE